MGLSRKPPQHQPFKEGRGYPYMMIALNKAELKKQNGTDPNPTFLAENTAAKSKLGKSWEPNSKIINEEAKKPSFFEITEDITKNIDALFTSGDQGLAAQANNFTATLNKLNKDLINYNEAKTHAEKTYHELQSELSANSPETSVKIKTHEATAKELPIKLKELEEGFDALKEQVTAVRRPIVGLRPE